MPTTSKQEHNVLGFNPLSSTFFFKSPSLAISPKRNYFVWYHCLVILLNPFNKLLMVKKKKFIPLQRKPGFTKEIINLSDVCNVWILVQWVSFNFEVENYIRTCMAGKFHPEGYSKLFYTLFSLSNLHGCWGYSHKLTGHIPGTGLVWLKQYFGQGREGVRFETTLKNQVLWH